MADPEQLAHDLYDGWVRNQHRANVAPPRWFALDEGLKAHWRHVAQLTLDAYEPHSLQRQSEDPLDLDTLGPTS